MSTTGTPRTLDQLYYIFRDGQPNSAITAQDMRDFVASIPQVQAIGDVRSFGAVADGEVLFDGAISSGSTTLVSASADFTGREGQVCFIEGAGPGGSDLLTSIFSVTNASSCVLSATAGTTVSGAEIRYGTDNTAAIQAAFDTSSIEQGARIYFPRGRYLTTASLTLRHGLGIEGEGFAYSIWLPVAPTMLICCASVPVLNSTITADSGVTDVRISKITFRGTRLSGSKGIHTARVMGMLVERCTFDHFGDQAIHMHGGQYTVHLWKCGATNCCLVRSRAAYVGVFDVDASDSFVSDCEVAASTPHGVAGYFGDGKIAAFKFSGNNSWIRDCTGHHSQIGFYCGDFLTTYINCRADYNQGHGYVVAGNSQKFGFCRAHANGFSAVDIYSGFEISGNDNIFAFCQVSSHYGEGSGPLYNRPKHAFHTTNNAGVGLPNQFLFNDILTSTSGARYQQDGTDTTQLVMGVGTDGKTFSYGRSITMSGITPVSLKFVNESSAADERIWTFGAQTISGGSEFTGAALNDAENAAGQWYIVTRSGITFPILIFRATNITLDGILNLKNGARHLDGTGDPNGSVTGNIGDTFSRRNGGAGTSFYVKESGSGNTGWVGK